MLEHFGRARVFGLATRRPAGLCKIRIYIMAHLISRNGFKSVRYVNAAGESKTLAIGKLTKAQASEVKSYVERLNVAKITRAAVDNRTAVWLAEIGDDLHERLAEHGLVAPRKPQTATPAASARTLGSFLESFLAKRATAKPNSLKNYKLAVAKLTEFFGADLSLDSLTPGKADDFARAMAAKHAKEWTWRLVKFARQFFHTAMRDKIVPENPFAGIKPPPQATTSRRFFVTREMAQQVLDACPGPEWALIFALARFAGLRVPSELLPLTWGDVNWERGRFLVHAPKTEHHTDGGERWVPIFPELRPYLEAAFDAAPPGSVHVVAKHRGTNSNLRQHLGRIIRKAGLTPWPKLFINCRASRETELAETFPIQVVTAWIGNSEPVARKHYLQVTEEHFARAAHDPARAPARAHSVFSGCAELDGVSQTPGNSAKVQGKQQERMPYNEVEEVEYTRQESNLQPMAP
jgi:integrase